MRIPSVFVSKDSYEILETVDTVTISAVDVGTSVIGTVIFLMVSPLCSLSLIYCVLLFHRRYKQLQERASKSIVAKLPTRIWVKPEPPASERGDSGNAEDQSQETGESVERAEASSEEASPSPSSTAAESDPLIDDDTDSMGAEKPWVSSGECIICMEDYVSGVSRVMRLPCYHEFHVECITRWLTTRKRTCPICKYDVTLGKRESFPPLSAPSAGTGTTTDTTTTAAAAAAAAEATAASPSTSNPVLARRLRDSPPGCATCTAARNASSERVRLLEPNHQDDCSDS